MSSIDPFGKTDRLDEATQEALVTRFEARGQHSLFSSMLRAIYVTQVPLDVVIW
jgi:hypothetical protein